MRKLSTVIVLMFIMVFAAACSSNTESSNGTSKETEGSSSTNDSSDTSKVWAPEKPIEIVAPGGAGGGWDTTARSVAKVFEEEGIIDQKIGVVNKSGGGGSIGWAYIAEKEGSAYNIFVSSPPLIFVPLNGQTDLTYESFTPISNMIADYGAFAVRADAKWNNLNELFDDMKKDPSSVTVVGASSPGSMDHMQFVKIAKAAGVDIKKIKYVSDQDGGALTALLNGSVDVYSAGVAETVEQARAGKIKVLAVTSENRLEGETLSDFPTVKEQGIDATFVNWRGFFGPANMDKDALAYYETKFKEASESSAFADIRKKFGWDEFYMNSEEYKSFLAEQTEELRELMGELGLGK